MTEIDPVDIDRFRVDFQQTLPPQTLEMVTAIAQQVGVPAEKYLYDIMAARFKEWCELVARVGKSEAARYFWSDSDDEGAGE